MPTATNQAYFADYYPLMKILKGWINRLRYRFHIWKSDRALTRQKKAIGRALLPAMKELLEQIESKDND